MRQLIHNRYVAFYVMLLLVGLQGCAGTNPIAAAETNEQRAYAAYGTFVIMQEKAADIVEGTDIPRGAKLRVIGAEERAKPIADSLLDAYTEYLVIRAEYEAGQTSEERFITAANSLDNWVTQLVPLLNELIRNIKGVEE